MSAPVSCTTSATEPSSRAHMAGTAPRCYGFPEKAPGPTVITEYTLWILSIRRLSTRCAKRCSLERESLNETARTSAESRKPVTLDQQSVGRLSRMDALQMQAMAVASDRRRQVRLQQIEAALGRIEEGEFGYCVVCGYEIEEGRLKNDPAMPSCITCASAGS